MLIYGAILLNHLCDNSYAIMTDISRNA